MCDTILASPNATAGCGTLFGKNSDRQRNEAQAVEYFARADHGRGAQLTCTYITIPQSQRTHAVLLCRPFWIWGAEMGANEYGVVIGNEGLRARGPIPEEKALIGMDLIRLALERATTAEEAIEVITTLLERHGQGGNCGHLTPSYYHNGFMVADAQQAFVLETVGREWLVEQVSGVRAISNRYSISRDVPRMSVGLMKLIQLSGWSGEGKPDYAEIIGDPHGQHILTAGARHARSTALMSVRKGQLRIEDLMSILRDHGAGDQYHSQGQERCPISPTVCMHAGAEDQSAQTVGSMVSEVQEEGAVHWVTGTSAPCISIFKPVLLDVPLPFHGPLPTDRFDSRTLWWQHERLHRTAIRGKLGAFIDDIREERDALEAEFRNRVNTVLNGGSDDERARVVAECWQAAIDHEKLWFEKIELQEASEPTPYLSTWEKMNSLAGVKWKTI